MKQLIYFLALCAFTFSMIGDVTAQVPNKISYQGLLTTSAGTPVLDGGYDLKFEIYNALSGGALRHTETQGGITVQRGTFSVVLDSLADIFSEELYVEVTVLAGPGIVSQIMFSPRSELTSAPYALRSFRSDTATFALHAPQGGYVDSARIAGTVPDNMVTSNKILNGTIQRIDVAGVFKAPYADTADYAKAATPGGNAGGDLTGTYPNPAIANNAVISSKILDGTIQRVDVQTTFKAPYADTSDYAKAAPTTGSAGGDLTGTYPNPTVANNAITSTKILDGTIQRGDVQSTFKAPYADTSDYAKAAPTTGIAGGDLTGTYPNPTVANNAITSVKISDGTIQRGDVQSTFKAPYADTADYAKASHADTADYSILAANVSGIVPIINGGTGGTNSSQARMNLGAAASGANSDIVSLSALTTPLSINQGGTGSSTKNFVDLSSAQSIDGAKTFNDYVNVVSSTGFKIDNTQVLCNIGYNNIFVGDNAGIGRTTGNNNSFLGYQSGKSNTTGSWNSFFGSNAGWQNSTGSNNLFIGSQSGVSNTTGSNNLFIGYSSGVFNTDASNNSFIGNQAGYYNTTGSENTFLGYQSGKSNTTGSWNSFFGFNSGRYNTSGNNNLFFGDASGYSNTTGHNNNFLGSFTGYFNTTGYSNVFLGGGNGYYNTTGSQNTFVGAGAGYQNIDGMNNIFLGYSTGRLNTSGYSNTFLGDYAGYGNVTGTRNTYVGYYTHGTDSLTNATTLGVEATITVSNAMRFGNSSVTRWGFGKDPTDDTKTIDVNNGAYLSSGGTWTNSCDRNLKENFTLIDGSILLQKILSLPISMWNYKSESKDVRHIGPTAQDFYSSFGLGNDDKSISTIDPAGVALAAIKELYKQNQELTKRVEQLESIVKSLAETKKNNDKLLGESR